MIEKIKRYIERLKHFILQTSITQSLSPKFSKLNLRLFINRSHFVTINISRVILFSTSAIIFLFFLYVLMWKAPSPFPYHALISVERGESLSDIAESFEKRRIVKSGLWLRALIILMGGDRNIIAGDYYFPEPKNIFRVAYMLHTGSFGLIPERFTIPEGFSSYEIAKILKDKLPAFDSKTFVDEVQKSGSEGYLFPDTYFFMPNTKSSDVILTMRENFARQIKTYEADIEKFGKPLDEVVIMASIIEDEANGTLESKRIVSGILWKRLRLDMPLQVDAPFIYYNGKNSYTLTKEDLAEDHEYNTYVRKGLPPTAITNPGIDSIRAAITPTNTEYLYFLSDKRGNMYYARNFEDHKRNKELYLN